MRININSIIVDLLNHQSVPECEWSGAYYDNSAEIDASPTLHIKGVDSFNDSYLLDPEMRAAIIFND